MREHQRRSGRDGTGRPTPGRYPIDSGLAEIIQDRDNSDGFLLLVNGAQSSYVDLSDASRLEFEYMRWMAAVIEHCAPVDEPLRALHLGAAACSLARSLIAGRPGSQHLAVDADAELTRLVRLWFDLPRAPALRIRVGDARTVTQALPPASRGVVIRDVFAGTVTPRMLTTVEFARHVRRVLTPGGLYLVNCGDAPDLRLARAEAATIGSVFAHLAVVADPPMLKGRRRGNVVIVGSDVGIGSSALTRELLGGAVPAQWWDDRRSRDFARSAQPLTDPPAPDAAAG